MVCPSIGLPVRSYSSLKISTYKQWYIAKYLTSECPQQRNKVDSKIWASYWTPEMAFFVGRRASIAEKENKVAQLFRIHPSPHLTKIVSLANPFYNLSPDVRKTLEATLKIQFIFKGFLFIGQFNMDFPSADNSFFTQRLKFIQLLPCRAAPE